MRDDALKERLREACEAIPVPSLDRPRMGRRGRYLKVRRYFVSGAAALVVLAGIVVPLRMLLFTSSVNIASSGRQATLVVQMESEKTSLRGEGFYFYLMMESKKEKKVIRLVGQPGVPIQPLSVRVTPGAYMITGYQRTCDAACPNLDPPSARCAKDVTLSPNAVLHVRVSVRPYQGCTIVTQS